MDNASKALIIAGGILLAVLVISVSLYLLTSVRGFANAMNISAEVSAVESFNRYYTSFGSKITGIDVVNIKNKAENDNYSGQHPITCKDGGIATLLETVADSPNGDKTSLTSSSYYYAITAYDADGYISEISISK